MADKQITAGGEKKNFWEWAGLIAGYTVGIIAFTVWAAWIILWPLLRLAVEFISFLIVGIIGGLFLGGRK